MSTGESHCEVHVAVAFFRCTTGVCAAAGTSLKALLGVEDFQAWGELDTACFQYKSESLSSIFEQLRRELYSKGNECPG